MPGIKAARAAGLNVLGIDEDSSAPGLAQSSHSLVVDVCATDAVIAAIAKTSIVPAGAISFCNDAGMSTVAAIRETYSLQGAGSHVTVALTNKGIQRAMWEKAGVPNPKWAVVTTPVEAAGAIQEINGTAILKPVDSAGSRGVSVVRLGEKWERAFENAQINSRQGAVIVEQFVEGVEYTIETFSHRGDTHILAITSKQKVSGTDGTVACTLESAVLESDMQARVAATVKQALAALDYRDGPGHTELIITGDGDLVLIETAGRGGGFMVADGLVPLTTGFNLTHASALQAVGLEPMIPTKCDSRFAVLRFIPSTPGMVDVISGFSLADEIPGVIAECLVAVGQRTGRPNTDGDRLAYVLAVGDSLHEARQKAQLRQQRIVIRIT